MVADNKKEPATGSGETASSTVVGSDTPSSTAILNIIRQHKKRTALILIGLLLFIGWLHFGLHVGEKVYAHAAGHNIYKSDIDHLIKDNRGISQRSAATVLADKYLTEAMAKKASLKITNNDIHKALGPGADQQKDANPYVYQLRVNQVYFKKLNDDNNGVYKGQLLVAQFSRYIAYQTPLLKERQAINPNIGNPAAIAADKQYAQNFITNLYSQIKSGKMTFNQAIQAEHSDSQVGERAYPTLSHSGSFDTSSPYINRNGLLEASSISSKVRHIKAGQMSEPFVVRVSNSERGTSTAESYYLVVKMDSVSGKPTGLSPDDYLTVSKKNFGYKINV